MLLDGPFVLINLVSLVNSGKNEDTYFGHTLLTSINGYRNEFVIDDRQEL